MTDEMLVLLTAMSARREASEDGNRFRGCVSQVV